MATLKIMSFNMRVDTPADGPNQFIHRRAHIKEFLDKEKPDIIGFQEITPSMREWVVEVLTDYYAVGVGRDATCKGEMVLTAFRKDKFALLSADTVMLSTTPQIFGSHYDGSDQSRCPREYVRVTLKHPDITEPFSVYNVHTDHIGKLSRILASSQLLQDITSRREKMFLLGDFNATPDAPEINMLTACKAKGIKDTTAALGGTFHGFGRTAPVKIDYIFADEATPITEAVRVDDTPGEGEPYLSDHTPIYIIAELV